MRRRFDLLLAIGPFVIAALLLFVVIWSAIEAEGDLFAYVPFMRYTEGPLWLVILVQGGFAAAFAWIGAGMLRSGRPPRTWGRSGDPRKR